MEPKKVRVKPGKAPSFLAMIVGGGMLLVGIFGFLGSAFSDPDTPPFVFIFAVVWIVAVGGMTIFYGMNFFGKKGINVIDIDVESDRNSENKTDGFESKLRDLEKLKKDKLITEEEYKNKRSKIMSEKW